MATATTTATKTRNELKSINPFNGEVMKTYDEMTRQEVDAAIATADEAFRQYRETRFEHRARILRRAADLLRDAAVHTFQLGGQLAAELCIPPNHGTIA
jgi:succinate-semialdehyde dehydrogenase/glutarate-semialdehyde dehydrogenase